MAEVNYEIITGIFSHLIFQRDNYAIWAFRDQDGPIVVTGPLLDIDTKEKYELHGEYVNHPKYGLQFNVLYFEKCLPESNEGIIAYLSGDLFKGIGAKTAKRIVDELGDDTLKLIKDDPNSLDRVKGLSQKQKAIIIEGLNTNLRFEESFYYLISSGLKVSDINKLLSLYKENTLVILEENPYRPYYDIYSIGFSTCDEIANKLNYDSYSKERSIALIHHILTDYFFRSGDTSIDYDKFKKIFLKEASNLDFDEVLNEALNDKKIIFEYGYYYTDNSYSDEINIARYLVYNNLQDEFRLIKNINEVIAKIALKTGITYDSKQIEAINNFINYKISLVIGGPGTGKTTIIRLIADIIREIDPTSSLHVVAPTGRAAKRIRELCNVESSTIHSLLKWDKETNTFTHNITNPLTVDYLIIDEFSMVDNWLFHQLINALSNVKKLCIIGDDNQLPSVGAGNLLNDILVSDLFVTTRLKKIFRQKEGSDIIKLSNEVLMGDISFDRDSDDVIFIEDADSEKLIEIIKNYLNIGYSLNDIQILSPMYRGALGIDSLNILLQEIFNPSSGNLEYKNKYRTLRVHDKVIQLKNQRDEDVYNGDVGEIIEISEEDKKLSILANYDDIYVSYVGDSISNIALAYCISVHKAQGSEYPIVIFAISKSHLGMLNKNLIYTAVSRASIKLILLGSKETLIRGINREMIKRHSTLVKRLLDYNLL